MWVEVNSRVNYPLKSLMNRMIETGKIDFTSTYVRFGVSWVLTRVANYGLELFISSWNHHRVPGKLKLTLEK